LVRNGLARRPHFGVFLTDSEVRWRQTTKKNHPGAGIEGKKWGDLFDGLIWEKCVFVFFLFEIF